MDDPELIVAILTAGMLPTNTRGSDRGHAQRVAKRGLLEKSAKLGSLSSSKGIPALADLTSESHLR
jgi:hypothetical protein